MERKLELILIEDEPSICSEIINKIDTTDDYLLIGSTSHATEAIEMIRESLPDAIILDLELHYGSGSGLDVLNALARSPLPKKPYILITTNNSSVYTHEAARKLGADFIMSKHESDYNVQKVFDLLDLMKDTITGSLQKSNAHAKKTVPESPEQKKRRLYRQICHELDLIGINPKSKGYQYLADAIHIIHSGYIPNVSNIIGEQYKKTPASVDRAMQSAIDRAWKTTTIDDLLEHYTAKIRPEKGVPTIVEFICYYANKIKYTY